MRPRAFVFLKNIGERSGSPVTPSATDLFEKVKQASTCTMGGTSTISKRRLSSPNIPSTPGAPGIHVLLEFFLVKPKSLRGGFCGPLALQDGICHMVADETD